MATSQLGNHCKSKREGDIKGMNEERNGGQREIKDGSWRQREEDSDVFLYTEPVDSLENTAVVKWELYKNNNKKNKSQVTLVLQGCTEDIQLTLNTCR